MEELRTRCPRKAQLSNEDLCRQLLRSLDLTGDGRLHFFEFLGAIIGCGRVEVKESDVASAFSALDVDCDGAVSAADLPSFVTTGAQDGVLRLPVTSVAEVFAALQVQLDFTASLSSKLRAAFERSSSGPLELHRERSRSTDTDSGTSPNAAGRGAPRAEQGCIAVALASAALLRLRHRHQARQGRVLAVALLARGRQGRAAAGRRGAELGQEPTCLRLTTVECCHKL
eukprot:SRR837773.8924.p1 GENE.SRR837773.8924~~SRR837773.8924.p1  ORF type:complete len:228 (-),score=60.34 SRR837773.8924:1-684(-)